MTEHRTLTATPAEQSPPPVRCAVYIRVNVGASWGTESVRMQREAAEAFLKAYAARGWTRVATFEDIGYSGGTLERPGLQRLLTAINAGTVDCVIVHTLDRLVRMYDDYARILVLPRMCDVKVVALCPEPMLVNSSTQRCESNDRMDLSFLQQLI